MTPEEKTRCEKQCAAREALESVITLARQSHPHAITNTTLDLTMIRTGGPSQTKTELENALPLIRKSFPHAINGGLLNVNTIRTQSKAAAGQLK